MKILFVQKEGGIFGAENYQLKVIPGLLDSDIQVEFLRLYTDYQGGIGGEFIRRLNASRVVTHEVNIGKYPTFKTLASIRDVIRQGSYDIIHTHLIHADVHLALIKSLFGVKAVLVSTKHGYDNKFTSQFGFDASMQRNTPYFLLSRWAERRMNASYTISNGLRNFFVKTGLTQSEKMGLIHYGFDMPDHFLKKGNKEFKLAKMQLMIAGRLVAFKGHKYLLNAMLVLKERYGSNVMLLIAGTGDLELELRDEVKRLEIESNVEFLGYSTEVGAYMANSDVVVVPSVSEGFGVVFLEAFAAKTPVVAWNVHAGKELLHHGVTGYLVQPYEVPKLASQLINVLEHPDDQDRITEGAYMRLKEYFKLSRMVDETINFYHTVLSK